MVKQKEDKLIYLIDNYLYYAGLHVLFFVLYIPAAIGFILHSFMDKLVEEIEDVGMKIRKGENE